MATFPDHPDPAATVLVRVKELALPLGLQPTATA